MIYQLVISDIQKYLESLPSTKTWINLSFQGIISNIINLFLVIAFVVFLFLLLLGGIQWITSGGDKESLARARGKITSAIIGIIIVISTWAILNLVKNFFGLTEGGIPPAGCTPPQGKIGYDGGGGCCGNFQSKEGNTCDSGSCRSWEKCIIQNGACASGLSCCGESGAGCSRSSDCCSGKCENNKCL
jgi:hypothetical protein